MTSICFSCSTSQGRKQWYTFSVDRRRLDHIQQMAVKDGKITRMLCKDCAQRLGAQPAKNPFSEVK